MPAWTALSVVILTYSYSAPFGHRQGEQYGLRDEASDPYVRYRYKEDEGYQGSGYNKPDRSQSQYSAPVSAPSYTSSAAAVRSLAVECPYLISEESRRRAALAKHEAARGTRFFDGTLDLDSATPRCADAGGRGFITFVNWGMRSWALNWACSLYAVGLGGSYAVYATDTETVQFLNGRGVRAHLLPTEHAASLKARVDFQEEGWDELMLLKFRLLHFFGRCKTAVVLSDADVTWMANVAQELFGVCSDDVSAESMWAAQAAQGELALLRVPLPNCTEHLGCRAGRADSGAVRALRLGEAESGGGPVSSGGLSLAFMLDGAEIAGYGANAGLFISCPTPHTSAVLQRALKDRDGANEQVWLNQAIAALVRERKLPLRQIGILNPERFLHNCDPPAVTHAASFHTNCAEDQNTKLCNMRVKQVQVLRDAWEHHGKGNRARQRLRGRGRARARARTSARARARARLLRPTVAPAQWICLALLAGGDAEQATRDCVEIGTGTGMGVGDKGYKSGTGSAMMQVDDWLRPSRWTKVSPFGWGYWGEEHCWKSAAESDTGSGEPEPEGPEAGPEAEVEEEDTEEMEMKKDKDNKS